MKNVREYYAQCIKSETPIFLKVMKAVPEDQAGYKPHPRSTSSGDLVWLLASELDDACTLIDRGEVNLGERPAPAEEGPQSDINDRAGSGDYRRL